MKAILEFNLPEDNYDHISAVYGKEMRYFLWEMFTNYFKGKDKYTYDRSDEYYEVVNEIREELLDKLEEEGLSGIVFNEEI